MSFLTVRVLKCSCFSEFIELSFRHTTIIAKVPIPSHRFASNIFMARIKQPRQAANPVRPKTSIMVKTTRSGNIHSVNLPSGKRVKDLLAWLEQVVSELKCVDQRRLLVIMYNLIEQLEE